MADLTPQRLTELRELAETATPGPWSQAGAIGGVRVNGPRGNWVAGSTLGTHQDASHIAAFDPPTALALLDEVERLRTVARAMVSVYDAAAPDWWPTEIDDLRAAIGVNGTGGL